MKSLLLSTLALDMEYRPEPVISSFGGSLHHVGNRQEELALPLVLLEQRLPPLYVESSFMYSLHEHAT